MRKLQLKRESLNFDELASKMEVVGREEQMGCVGGGNGTAGSPYTWSEYESLEDSGRYNGGYVQNYSGGGYSYMAGDGNSSSAIHYQNANSQNTDSFDNFVRSGGLGNSSIDQIVSYIISKIPILGDYLSYLKQEVNDKCCDMLGDISDMGYCGSCDNNRVTLTTSSCQEGVRLTFYDAYTGTQLTSRTIDRAGF